MNVRQKSNIRKRKLRFPSKKVLVSLLSLTAVLLLLFFSFRYLTTSEYFKIEDSQYFVGQNIFKINLQQEVRRLSHMYPNYKRVALKLILPNKITVDFIPHRAVALLKLSDEFYVDEEGVLFHSDRQGNDNLQLPLLIGLKSRISNPYSGVKCSENSLLTTLKFIDNFNKDSTLAKDLKIKEINLTNVNDVFLFTTIGCKINLGSIGSLDKKLSILRRLISEIDADLTNIKYIDLRFREPAVKYR